MLICVAEINEAYNYASIPGCLHHQVTFSAVIHFGIAYEVIPDCSVTRISSRGLMSTVKFCMYSGIYSNLMLMV